MTQVNIIDESGDKEFFTILPNYIANHSTANDQALYFQMKRITGENGRCFATEETLMRKLGIGKKAYDKALKYLLDNKWISYVGLTKGKTRPIKTYKVNNIWKLNSETYKKIPSESNISPENQKDTFQKKHKIPSESNVEQEPALIKTNNILTLGKEINDLIELFKGVNPTYDKLFANKTQRAAMERLLARMGSEKLGNIIRYLPKIIGQKYAPTITNPVQLEDKMGSLFAYMQKQKSEANNNTLIL